MFIANSSLSTKWLLAVLIGALLLLPLRIGLAANMEITGNENVCMHDMHQTDTLAEMSGTHTAADNHCNMDDGCSGQCLDCGHCQILVLPLSLGSVSIEHALRLSLYTFRAHEYISPLNSRPPRHLV